MAQRLEVKGRGVLVLFFIIFKLPKLEIKRVSTRKPGRTRQEVIILKSPISLELGTNVEGHE